jgi:hypothetical protein
MMRSMTRRPRSRILRGLTHGTSGRAARLIIDTPPACTHFEHMTRKTVSLDVDVYRRIKGRQNRHESISATLRRVLEEERDPADYLDGLFREFGGKGLLTEGGRIRLQSRRKNRARSTRPARTRR